MLNSAKLAAAAGCALVLVATALVSIDVGPAANPGELALPGGRTYLCYVDGHLPSGQIRPVNPACAQAWRAGGSLAFYDWFGVSRPDGRGRARGFIPDGALCGAGLNKYAGFDTPRGDWPVTHVTAGAPLHFRYGAFSADAGLLWLFVSRDAYQETKVLTWQDMEPAPFYGPDQQGPARLPDKAGRHLIYSVWHRPGSEETFYSCSDVVFDGGGGEVTGIRAYGPHGDGLGKPA